MKVESIRIGSAAHSDQVRLRLEFEARFLRDEGFAVSIGCQEAGPTSFHTFACQPPRRAAAAARRDDEALVRHHVVNAVSDLVVNTWEPDLLARIVDTDYGTLDAEERAAVVRQAQQLLDGPPGRGAAGLMHKVGRKGHVLREADLYLQGARVLIVEGFVRFRLRGYLAHLEGAVERAMDDFVLQKEYREFILLLRHFLAAQDARVERVHVLLDPDGAFRLLDDAGTSITEKYLEECMVETGTKDVNRDDLLVSALITLAPCRVRVHIDPGTDREALRTLRAVFAERLTTCHGCELCGLALRRQRDEQERFLR